MPVTFEVNCCVRPTCRLGFVGEIVTTMGGVTVTVALPTGFGATVLVAVIAKVCGNSKLAGAVYKPVASMVPTVALPPAMPLTAQVTVVVMVPVTVAVNCCIAPVAMLGVEGDTLTVMGVVMDTTVVATKEGSTTLVAVTVTVPGVGGATAGAMYKPDVVMVPTELLPPGMPLTAKLTLVLEWPVTVTKNCTPRPTGTETGVIGFIEMVAVGRTVKIDVPCGLGACVLVAAIVTVVTGTLAGAV